ncbi:mannose-P-dolichol utilization defect 1 protein homolog [Cimex lectularius]|uniref:Mannose-P-dolichol utilization defect 1 protein homolog n=1 Tax=Cimex lectularius TaxID=79782 RepID=A0A8I6RR38_CIMLE|nr:mannose-P-dolichol utilization defect 1 protein homolog [Cimex lectularius]
MSAGTSSAMGETSLAKSLLLNFMPEKCYNEFFYNYNFFNVFCLKALISKCLGLAIIGGSLMVKVPQIVKIWANQSAEGVSFTNVLTDLYAITSGSSYAFVQKFPFSAYGEGLFLGLQTVTIAVLVLHFNVSSNLAAVFTALYAVVIYVLTSGLTPVSFLWNLQAVSVPIMFFGKLTQAYTNYKNGGTGQLSAATCVMLLFGNVARIFTSIQETGDMIIIVTYLLATIGNGIIVGQFIFYRKGPVERKKKKQ